MRKLLAAFLLAIFAFNVGGYYLIFWGLQYHAIRQITARADAGAYTTDDEITFRVAITLPYTMSQDEFTRVNGEFEHHGEFYRVIKQKIVDGQLVLICLKNHQQKKITHALSDLAKINHLPGNAKHNLRTLAKFFKDFQSSDITLLHAGSPWSLELGFTNLVLFTDPPSIEIAGPPPRQS